MKMTIIKIPNGEAILASAIVAVCKGDRATGNGITTYPMPILDRVIIDYSTPDICGRGVTHNAIIANCDTPEERDALAARVIAEWEAAISES